MKAKFLFVAVYVLTSFGTLSNAGPYHNASGQTPEPTIAPAAPKSYTRAELEHFMATNRQNIVQLMDRGALNYATVSARDIVDGKPVLSATTMSLLHHQSTDSLSMAEMVRALNDSTNFATDASTIIAAQKELKNGIALAAKKAMETYSPEVLANSVPQESCGQTDGCVQGNESCVCRPLFPVLGFPFRLGQAIVSNGIEFRQSLRDQRWADGTAFGQPWYPGKIVQRRLSGQSYSLLNPRRWGNRLFGSWRQ